MNQEYRETTITLSTNIGKPWLSGTVIEEDGQEVIPFLNLPINGGVISIPLQDYAELEQQINKLLKREEGWLRKIKFRVKKGE